MFNLIALPRASTRARITFALFTAITLWMMAQQWSGIHDATGVSRWFAWALIAGCALSLPRMLVVVVFGRVPKGYAGFAATIAAPAPLDDDGSSAAPRVGPTGSREL